MYFAGYVLLTVFAFYREYRRAIVTTVAALLLIAFATPALVWTGDVLGPVGEKIYTLAIEGDSTGGRGLSVLFDYMGQYPFGLSYGGSTLRTAPGMDEINSGILAFFAQLSFLAPLFILAILVLSYRGIRLSGRLERRTGRTLAVGIVMMLVIFSADILWFVPTIWAAIVLCYQFARLRPRVAAQSVAVASSG